MCLVPCAGLVRLRRCAAQDAKLQPQQQLPQQSSSKPPSISSNSSSSRFRTVKPAVDVMYDCQSSSRPLYRAFENRSVCLILRYPLYNSPPCHIRTHVSTCTQDGGGGSNSSSNTRLPILARCFFSRFSSHLVAGSEHHFACTCVPRSCESCR